MKTKECSHPNCRLLSTKPHPRVKGDNGLCDEHYNETLGIMEKRTPIIALTLHNE